MRKRTNVKSLEPAEVLRRAEELRRAEAPVEQQAPPQYLLEQGAFSAGFAEADFSPEDKPAGDKVVTLHAGRTAYGTEFYKWLCSTRRKGDERRDLTLTRFDEAGAPIRTWKVGKALPFRVTGLQLKAKGNEVLMQVVVIVYESMEQLESPMHLH